MKSDIIDRLYDVYINEDEVIAQDVLMSAYLRPESQGGRDVLINHVKDYINANIGNLPNYYSSKETISERDAHVLNVHNAMVDVAAVIDFYRAEVLEQADKDIEMFRFEEEDFSSEYVPEEDDYLNDYESFEVGRVDVDTLFPDPDDYFVDTPPQGLFNMGLDAMEIAYNKYKHKVPGLTYENFHKIQAWIDYVKKTDLVSKVFGDNDVCKFSLETVISALVDADGNLMKSFHVEPLLKPEKKESERILLFDYFQYMKAGCDQIKDIDFKEYRATFISKRGFNVDLDKLVFARNYLEFIRTGMMPSPDGVMYMPVDPYELFKVKEDFVELYRKGFDNKAFAERQGNYIFDIENAVLYPDKLEKIKAVRNGKEVSIGCLLSSRIVIGKASYDDTYFLMHIHMDDVTNNKSNYELQLNVLPAGSFDNRIQLVRFDNWAEEQTHKNLGNKLKTTTHIHLYNHFDLLRGKKNGGYDIAFNLEEDSIDFDVALKVFLEFVSTDEKLYKELLNRLSKVKSYAEERVKESEMS